jgi:DNA polymerase-3 subunit epsilon
MFYGDDGSPLYVGKSVNIRDRVLSHFSNDKEIKISQAVKSMETIKTDSELEALILEANLVKSKQPIFNRQLRNKLQFSLIRQTTDENGYSIATIETVKTIDDTDNILAICKSTKEAKTLLKNKVDDFELCAKLLNLEKTKGACFSCQINKCKGACIGKENPGIYNVRFLQAFEKSKIKNWPFKGSVLIHNKLIVNKWKLGDGAFDWDTYKILARFIFDIKNQKYIKSFENVEFLEATPS